MRREAMLRVRFRMMLGGAARRRGFWLLAVGLLAASAALALHAANSLSWFERSTVDARFSIRGGQHAPTDVVVVGIDDSSLGQLPRYPFSRQLHARALQNLHAAGARLIVYDISFDRPTTEAADLALLEAARQAAPVVFGTSLISPSGATQVLGGNANLAGIGDQAAAAVLLPDSDGVLRHTLDDVSGLPTVAAAVARRLTDSADTRLLSGGWIDFPGPPGTVHTLSFASVLNGHFDPATVRGKVVVVGASAPVLQDLHTTAAGSPMAGPEVQADAIATALANFPLRSPSGVVTVLLILTLSFLVPLATLRLGTLGTCLVGLATLGLWSLATQLSFDSGAVLDYSDPLAALVLSAAGTVMLGMWDDGHERQRLRGLFAADAGGVVQQVLSTHGPTPIEPTGIIAGYRIEDVLGRGGMGVVYRARQLALDREVAIKLIAADRAQDPVFRERFKAESRIAASIEHANVIPVYEAGEDDGLLFIAMRLVDGFDLGQLLARSGALAPERAAQIAVQISAALDAAHARGLVHRDVKPANVLLTLDNPEHVYLTDFGVAKYVAADARITRADQWVGTLDYLAPEQIRGEALRSSADIYSLTCLVYHCLTGQPPFPRDSEAATMWAHVSVPPPSVCATRADLPGTVDQVIARGMAKEPTDRFPTARDLAAAFAHALGVPIESTTQRSAVISEHDQSSQSAPTLLSD